MFTQSSTSSMLLRNTWAARSDRYRTVTFSGSPFQMIHERFDWPCRCPKPPPEGGFGLFRVRSPLLTESRLLSFPPATEMFQFTGFAPTTYAFSRGFPLAREGCPIRRSQDQGSVTSSPGHFAGSNVLHRLSTPRHPPCALSHLIAPTRFRPIGLPPARAAKRTLRRARDFRLDDSRLTFTTCQRARLCLPPHGPRHSRRGIAASLLQSTTG
jgi:hypothetical protein